MEINTSPVKVEVVVENFNLVPDAFYTVCFIAESDEAPRTLNVRKLSDLLENGYMRYQKVFNFVYSVLSQRSMTNVIVRAKRTNETYEQAFDADDNSNYYYIVIQDKNPQVVLDFNDHITARDDFKLQFFSGLENIEYLYKGKKIVYYYQSSFSSLNAEFDGFYDYWVSDSGQIWLWDEFQKMSLSASFSLSLFPPQYTDGVQSYWKSDDVYLYLWDGDNKILLEKQDVTYEMAISKKALYPEGAWIGRCGYAFPSRMQWLHKYLQNVDGFNATTIPNLSTTSFMIRGTDKATAGSGMTGQSAPIHLQVSLDWLKYALQKSIWNKLYKEEVIPATSSGSLILENEVKRILDLCVTEKMFSEYEVFSRNVDSKTSTASFKFKATLIHPILGVDKVDGVIYH